jgi:cytochrome P450
VTLDSGDAGCPFLITKDPPEHTWHRKIAGRMFTPRRIAQLESFIRDTAAGLLDQVRDRDRFDLVREFSARLPLDVISELIGIPAGLRGQVHELSNRMFAREEDMSLPEGFHGAVIELIGIFGELVKDRRENPGDDVITMLMNTEVEDEAGSMRRLDDGELAMRFLELAFAGHETVAKLIERRRRPRLVPRSTPRAGRRPRADRERGRGNAALGPAVALPGPVDHAGGEAA